MAGSGSAWRASDAVAYDEMREAANDAIASLLRLSNEGAMLPSTAVAQVAAIRRELFRIDGYERAAVDVARETFDAQATHLDSPSP